MKEATPVAGKVIPPALNKRAVSNNKGPVQTTSLGVRIAAGRYTSILKRLREKYFKAL